MKLPACFLVLLVALFHGWGMARAEGEGGARSLEEIEQHSTLSLPFLAEAARPDTTPFHGENFYGYTLPESEAGSANGFTLVAVLDFSRYVSPAEDWHLLRMEDVGNFPYQYYPMLFIPKPTQRSGEMSVALHYFKTDDESCGYNEQKLSAVTLSEPQQGYVALAITISSKGTCLYVGRESGEVIDTVGAGIFSELYLGQEMVKSGLIQAAYTFDTALSAAEVQEYGAQAVAYVEAASGSPTPEPGTGSLLALSLAALEAKRRRRRAA